MIETIYNHRRCLKCRALFTDRNGFSELCLVCRGRAVRGVDRDTWHGLSAWRRGVVAQVFDLVRENARPTQSN